MPTKGTKKKVLPAQHQDRQPGFEHEMRPRPRAEDLEYQGSGKLEGRTALITGGDSGIGRAVAIAFAREGARCSLVYLNEDRDARETERLVKKAGGEALLIAGDIADSSFCADAVNQTVDAFGAVNVLVNNAAQQFPQERIEDISPEQLETTFRINIFSMFYLVQHALPHMKKGDTIINTTSVTAYRGSPHLVDYASTKGAIVAFTRSLALQLVDRGIRVNAVAPGPFWTPLIPASFDKKKVSTFGSDVPMGRPGQPEEIAPCYVLLACDDSSYMTGQVLHPNGGEIING